MIFWKFTSAYMWRAHNIHGSLNREKWSWSLDRFYLSNLLFTYIMWNYSIFWYINLFSVLYFITGVTSSAWRGWPRGLWRGSNEGHSTTSSTVPERQWWPRRAKRWPRPRKCHSCQASSIPKEYGRTHGKFLK